MQNKYLDPDFDPFKETFSSIEEEREACSILGSLFSFMPEASGDKPPKWLLKENVKDEVVFYPGTFNPWHLGHRACLELCPSGPLIVVPDFNPWKEDQERSGPWKCFLDLLNRLKDTNISVYPGFLAKEEGNPTAAWFSQVKVKRKSLLLGADSFLSLHDWKNSDELVQSISTLYVVPRDISGSLLEEQKEKYPKLKIVFLDNHEFEGVSSSGIRGGVS